MDSLYIVLPAYNEEKNIKNVISDWYPVLNLASEDSKIVVADFGCKDRTHDILMEMINSSYPKLEILTNDNQFHGPKLIALYKYAIKKGADYVFQTDSDGQTNPSEFLSFWECRDQYSGIFGNRTVRGDGKDRAFVEKVVCALLLTFFGIKVPDANAPFRLMNCKVLSKYIDFFPSDYNLPNIMLTTLFKFYNEPILFKEISFKSRAAGNNSINIKKIVKIGFDSLKDFAKFRKKLLN